MVRRFGSRPSGDDEECNNLFLTNKIDALCYLQVATMEQIYDMKK
jgi:hypothetical protein